MTVFGPAWHDLALADLEAFLEDADDEPLLWEAKGTKLDRHEIRKQVCGFANSHEGGYLILGAKQQGGRWELDPLEFPDEPAPWINKIIRDGGVRPVPDIDPKPFPAGDGRHVAVVRVQPIATPPCNARGIVYERVSGETIPVRDPQRLASLFTRGDDAHRNAQVSALRAAEAVIDHATELRGYNREHVQFGLGLACAGRRADVSAGLFTSRFEEAVLVTASDLTRHGPFSPQVYARWTQTTVSASSEATVVADRTALVMGSWDGSTAVFDLIATEMTVVQSLVQHRVSDAWQIAADLQRLLGATGDAYLALLVTPSSIRAEPTDATSPYVRVTRGPMPLDPSAEELASIRRELERATGEHAYEPQLDE